MALQMSAVSPAGRPVLGQVLSTKFSSFLQPMQSGYHHLYVPLVRVHEGRLGQASIAIQAA